MGVVWLTGEQTEWAAGQFLSFEGNRMADDPKNPWESYALNRSVPYWELPSVPRREAQEEYGRTMREKPHRLRQLAALVHAYGIVLAQDDTSVQSLNDWFAEVMNPLPDRAVPDGVSLSVCEDVALFLGDVMIDRHQELRWEFHMWGRNNLDYQNHVIMGFPFDEPKLHTSLGLAGIIHGYGVHILEKRSDAPNVLALPDGHPLDGVVVDAGEVDPAHFLALLGKVDARCRQR